MPEPVLHVENLGKSYWLYTSNLRRAMGNFIAPARTGATPLKVLSGLTFDLYPGEAIALIGKNGAGKSTALQILAGIIPPTEGSFTINGRVSALLELGSGFNPEFTGRENIAIAGALVGLTHEEIAASEQEIIEFADIGEFIDQPVKFYSSGMFLRLAFAVAIAGKPDLLIVDEALAVGDVFFRQKCYTRLREMRDTGMSVILVTHSAGDAQEFCDRAILIDHGKQLAVGEPEEIIYEYYLLQQQDRSTPVTPPPVTSDLEDSGEDGCNSQSFPWPFLDGLLQSFPSSRQQLSNECTLSRYCVTDEENKPRAVFVQGQVMRVYAEFILGRCIQTPATGVTIFDERGKAAYSKSSLCSDLSPLFHIGPGVLYSLHEIQLDLGIGEYSLSFGLNEVIPELTASREVAHYQDWIEGNIPLAVVTNLSSIQIVLPDRGVPSRVKMFGLVDLPSKEQLVYSEGNVGDMM